MSDFDESSELLERAYEAYAKARQMALDLNQPACVRQEWEREAQRISGSILELLD